MPQLYIVSREDSLDPELMARHRAKATSQQRRLVVEDSLPANGGVTDEEITENPASAVRAGNEAA